MKKSCEKCKKNSMYLANCTDCIRCAKGEIDAYEEYEPVIAIMNKPKNCQECPFGVCKFSHPLWSNKNPGKKGYYCQKKAPDKRVVEEFDYDEPVHLSGCPLKPVPKKQVITQLDTMHHRFTKEGYNLCINELLKETE